MNNSKTFQIGTASAKESSDLPFNKTNDIITTNTVFMWIFVINI